MLLDTKMSVNGIIVRQKIACECYLLFILNKNLREVENMRTRNFNFCTNHEIESYLKKNDVIFIPVGNCEMHNPYPVDVEGVQAEAWAKLFAERYDGLYLPNLSYLPAGATVCGRGTIQVGMFEAMHYLYTISRSLLRQGFRRQIFIPSHGPSAVMALPVIHQLLDDTKVPFLILQPEYLFMQRGLSEPHFRRNTYENPIRRYFKPLSDEKGLGDNAMPLGAYQIVGRLDCVPTGEEANIEGTLCPEGTTFNFWFPKHDIINECSSLHAPAPFFYTYDYHHAAGPLPQTREEMKKEADLGEKRMRDLVDRCGFDEHLQALRELDEHIRNEVLPVVGNNLPENRWSY